MAKHNLYSEEGPRYCDMGQHQGDMVIYVKGPIYLSQDEYARYATPGSLGITVGQQQESARPKNCVTCQQQLVFEPGNYGTWRHKDQRFDTHKASVSKPLGK